MVKRLSPFSTQFWINKDYSEDDAKYQVSIRRPSNINFWINKGYSEDAAKQKVLDHNKNATKKSMQRSEHEMRRVSKRCIEYWLSQGHDEETAKQKLMDYQTNFSKNKCIEKHGFVEGIRVWKERQDRWQTTMKNKPMFETLIINSKKGKSIEAFLNRGFCLEDAINEMREFYISRQYSFCESEVSLVEMINSFIQESCYNTYLPIKVLAKKFNKPQYFLGWKKPTNFTKWIEKNILNLKNPHGSLIFKDDNQYGWCAFTPTGKLLRSSSEIYFYSRLEEIGLKEGKTFFVEKYYPNSMMRCDFYVNGCWVELCGMNNIEKYRQKMLYKQKTFGSILLNNKQEIDDWLEKCNVQ